MERLFASHIDGPEICWDYYMKDINVYQAINDPSNSGMPFLKDFSKLKGWICPVCGRDLRKDDEREKRRNLF